MELKIQSETKQPLLHRVQVVALVHFTGATPKPADVATAIAKVVKSDVALINVLKIEGKFGETTALATAHVYDTAEHMKAIMPKVKEKKAATPESGAK